ncbi:hypothetical protein ABZP36_020186 [Zizania latifolia]
MVPRGGDRRQGSNWCHSGGDSEEREEDAVGGQVKMENKTWKIDTETRTLELELTMLSSAHHVEMNPSDAGFHDRYVVQEVIKEMAKNAKGKRAFKVLILNEVDKLPRDAQHSLRRIMEKYSASCRLILCCNSSSKVTEALRSRCLNVQVNAPTEDQVILEFIGKNVNLYLPAGFAARIAAQLNRNLRRDIVFRDLKGPAVCLYPFTSNQVAPPLDWEQLYAVRQKFYELLVNCIPPESILKKLLAELLKKLDSDLKHEICHWAAHYVTFVAKFMSIYKKFLVSTFG